MAVSFFLVAATGMALKLPVHVPTDRGSGLNAVERHHSGCLLDLGWPLDDGWVADAHTGALRNEANGSGVSADICQRHWQSDPRPVPVASWEIPMWTLPCTPTLGVVCALPLEGEWFVPVQPSLACPSWQDGDDVGCEASTPLAATVWDVKGLLPHTAALGHKMTPRTMPLASFNTSVAAARLVLVSPSSFHVPPPVEIVGVYQHNLSLASGQLDPPWAWYVPNTRRTLHVAFEPPIRLHQATTISLQPSIPWPIVPSRLLPLALEATFCEQAEDCWAGGGDATVHAAAVDSDCSLFQLGTALLRHNEFPGELRTAVFSVDTPHQWQLKLAQPYRHQLQWTIHLTGSHQAATVTLLSIDLEHQAVVELTDELGPSPNRRAVSDQFDWSKPWPTRLTIAYDTPSARTIPPEVNVAGVCLHPI